MFSELGLSPAMAAQVARLGYETPTPVQTQAIPIVLTGVDLLARAQTGTGKTAAFGLPMIERLMKKPVGATRKPRALVLVPTRELAAQVHRALSNYAIPANLRVVAIFGGVGMHAQIQALRRGTDIIVATPGRLIDHMQQRTADLSSIEVLVLDEADRMLDMGFLPALRRLLSALPRERQTLLFSATLPEPVIRLSADFTRKPSRVDVSEGQVVANTVKHQVHDVFADQKRDALVRILTEHGESQALVFCKTKRGANRVGEDLEARGLSADVIHGNKSQNARTRALDGFKAGRVRILVATDIAARGLDIKELPLVVNFDLPLVAEDYVHRIGRTGRAGRAGHAVSLVTGADAGLLRDIQRLVTEPLERVGGPARAASTGQPSHGNGHAPHARQPHHAGHGPNGPGRRRPEDDRQRRRFRPRGRRPGGARPAAR